MNNAPGIMASDKIPSGYVVMNHQVAGHTFQIGTDEMGMLKSDDDGSVLKPGGSPMCAAREIKFYEQLLTTTDPSLLPLKDFTAEYRGTQTLTVGNKTINFIKLRDVTHGMLEPCVIDIKMGRRTWDPLASEQKREAEDSRYVDCKTTVGFCIPGFQTYHLQSGNYKKFGRDYGKKLNQNTVKDGKWKWNETGLNLTNFLHSFAALPQRRFRPQPAAHHFDPNQLMGDPEVDEHAEDVQVLLQLHPRRVRCQEASTDPRTAKATKLEKS